MQKIICLHCYKDVSESAEKHMCLNEIFDLFANAITEIKETECKNSGLNWRDYYTHLMKRYNDYLKSITK